VGVAEVLGREAHADDEGRGAGGTHGAGDGAEQARAVGQRAAPVVVALVHRPAQELTEEVAVGGVQLDARRSRPRRARRGGDEVAAGRARGRRRWPGAGARSRGWGSSNALALHRLLAGQARGASATPPWIELDHPEGALRGERGGELAQAGELIVAPDAELAGKPWPSGETWAAQVSSDPEAAGGAPRSSHASSSSESVPSAWLCRLVSGARAMRLGTVTPLRKRYEECGVGTRRLCGARGATATREVAQRRRSPDTSGMGLAVGIDLGTTNSVVAIATPTGVEFALGPAGERVHPSVVSFHPNGSVVVGLEAKQRRIIDPRNTVYSAKRLIGRSFRSREIHAAMQRMPFEIEEGANQQPVIVTRRRRVDGARGLGHVLDHRKQCAQRQLGQRGHRRGDHGAGQLHRRPAVRPPEAGAPGRPHGGAAAQRADRGGAGLRPRQQQGRR
jgi:hypothetical protein